MISRGELVPPPDRSIRYVYIKMLVNQADAQEGKLTKGECLVVPEDKATRWVYRARIAVPISRKEYDTYRSELLRQRGYSSPYRGLATPEDASFEYAEGAEEATLSDQFASLDDEDDGANEVNSDEPGVYDARIDRGPGEGRTPTPRPRGRGRSRSQE